MISINGLLRRQGPVFIPLQVDLLEELVFGEYPQA